MRHGPSRFRNLYEISLDGWTPETIERVLNAGNRYDPTFDAACALEEGLEEFADSTAINRFWDLHNLYGSQWVIRKRYYDRQQHKKHRIRRELKKLGRIRERRGDGSRCTALIRNGSGRYQCSNAAIWIKAQKAASGYWSYQRRCESCFAKVKSNKKYTRINDGRYF